jgi:serine/threonine protein kinase
LPGYRLLSPLGRGGFGEVWKAEAPGGLLKAIKFVVPHPDLGSDTGSHALRQEFEAFQHIKAIRHPFILQLERVELIGDELIMVMELADSQLQDRFNACVAAGLPGIPREELLGYFADAAEALDVIGTKYGLQHLDIKPANIFLVSGHAKVGDYGLVARLETVHGGPSAQRGLTPRYVAPEILSGVVDSRSDQYSLALVYQELLTGTFPYAGRTPAQLMLQHVNGPPDLSGLPERDRGPVARALQKDPAQRFASCSDFVHALMMLTPPPPLTVSATPVETAKAFFRRNRLGRSAAVSTPAPTAATVKTIPALPPLTVAVRSTQQAGPPASTPVSATAAYTRSPVPPALRLKEIHAVVAVASLTGESDQIDGYSPDEFVEALVSTAAGWKVPLDAGVVTRLPDGAWACRFPSDLVPAVVLLKLKMLLEEGWCDELTQPDPGQVVLRIRSPAGGRWRSRSPGGAEVTIQLPIRSRSGTIPLQRVPGEFGRATSLAATGPTGEATVLGELYGDPDPEFVRRAAEGLPELLRQVRRVLQTTDERRKTRRLTFDGPMTAYPLTPEGEILPPIRGHACDVSAGGAAWFLTDPLPSRYAYLEFGSVEQITGYAILTRVLRSQAVANGHTFAGRFRTDL